MPADAKDINLLFTRMRLSEQRTRRPAIELAIKNAEEVFREEELADDWRGRPLETDRIASGQAMNDQPGYWAAGVRYAAPIVVAHVTAEADGASDPRRFEKSIDDIIYAVAATTFEAKLSGYAKIGSQRERAVIDQFSRDVRNAIHREMKQLARAVWRKYEPHQTISAAGTASPPADTDGDQSVPASGEPTRGPRPDRESLLVNKRSVTRLEAASISACRPGKSTIWSARAISSAWAQGRTCASTWRASGFGGRPKNKWKRSEVTGN